MVHGYQRHLLQQRGKMESVREPDLALSLVLGCLLHKALALATYHVSDLAWTLGQRPLGLQHP
jgi:hypothetical protein